MRYGCIGEKLSHSFSKQIHEALCNESYELLELTPDELSPFITRRGYRALNVTIPYKESVIPMLDEIDPLARRIGAVNTIVNKDGRLFGYNTDFYGLCALIRHASISLKGKKVAILGTGGTAKTAHAVAEHLGAREILLVSRFAREGVIDYARLVEEHTDIEILIHTTPVGMYPSIEEQCVRLECFPRLSGVIDAVYNPLRTRLVLAARRRGIAAEGGLYMLVAQAVRASELFHDCTYGEQTIEELYNEIRSREENIVLIGMPSSGKSTLGEALARELCRPFYDTDALFFERYGKRAGEYIEENGVDAFRSLENEIVRELAPLCSAVIATGGGTVLNQDNVNNLLHNGRIYFIDRPLEELTPTKSRPLSRDRDGMQRLYRERISIYRRCADLTVSGSNTPQEITRRILEDHQK